MNSKKNYFSFFSGIIIAAGLLSQSSLKSAEIYPPSLKGVREIYPAREVVLGLPMCDPNSDDAKKRERNFTLLKFYAENKGAGKIFLPKSFDLQLGPRTRLKGPLLETPYGYFIAYGSDDTAWLITLVNRDCYVAITRLKHAADDPEFLNLYWAEPEEPDFKSQSRDLFKFLLKDADGKLPLVAVPEK